MDLPNHNQLYYFWRVAREGGFTVAARHLHTTQSNLSTQIRSLEKYFGKTLFDRDRRGVRLTASGELLLEYALRMFGPAENLRDRLRRDIPPPPTALRLGFSMGLSSALLNQIQRFLRTIAPRVILRVVTSSPGDLQGRLLRHQLDLVASSTDVSHGAGSALRARLVARLPMYFVATATLARFINEFPRDLARIPVLLRLTDHPTRKEVDRFFYRSGVTPPIAMESESADALRALTEEGAGASALDGLTLRLSAGNLKRLHPRPLPFFEHLWFIHHRAPLGEETPGSPRDALIERFTLPT